MSSPNVQEWLNGPIDPKSKRELLELMDAHPEEVEEAFSQNLQFGTGGMRGIMGIGTNRMNLYTVQMATQGLANYLLKRPPETASRHAVFISFDSRLHSKEFALEAAKVLAGNRIQVYLTPELRPTPFVSFGVRQKRCTAGIMITASHNPKEYNGYKVYWDDGAQVLPPHDRGIIDEVNKIKDFDQIQLAHEHSPLVEWIDPEFDLEYLDALATLQLDTREDQLVGDRLKITYTPLHGTGMTLLPAALRRWGFSNLNLVEQQIVPDGTFPTVKTPNPESAEALSMGIRQLTESQSDLLIATDPDADRMAVATLHRGKPYVFNGNQIACLCLEYICTTLKQQDRLPDNGAAATTIVSSDLIGEIARSHRCACFEVLTGFKYIGQLIEKWEKDSSHTFLFGAEESYGYLMGTHSRDKDAIISACLVAEIALLMQVEGRTLVDLLEEIYARHGRYMEKQRTIAFAPGPSGMAEMEAIMVKLRSEKPTALGGHRVIATEDYAEGFNQLPPSNVLLYRLEKKGKVVVRPSGTEPKLKLYAGMHEPDYRAPADALEAQVDGLLDAVEKSVYPS